MSRDVNGVYSLPSGYLAVPGETIQASQHNPPLEDLAQAMTDSLPRSGAAPMGGPLRTITGSSTAPAVYPNANPSIGMYWTTTGVAFAGTVAGVRFIGELIPWTMLAAPALCVLPYGQTLLRASYPQLWAKAQTDIAAGNTFYNNGDGSTTFGIGDLRGRVVAAMDNMGGSDSARNAGYAAAKVMGGTAGNALNTITQANLPAISPTFNGDLQTVTVNSTGNNVLVGVRTSSTPGGAFNITYPDTQGSITSTGQFRPSGTISPLGSGAAISNLQNTMFLNVALYVGA